jgi:hypothetical protein
MKRTPVTTKALTTSTLLALFPRNKATTVTENSLMLRIEIRSAKPPPTLRINAIDRASRDPDLIEPDLGELDPDPAPRSRLSVGSKRQF